MRYIPTRKENPCPFCQKDNGDCRDTDEGFKLCTTKQEVGALRTVGGEIFVNRGDVAKNPMWDRWEIVKGNPTPIEVRHEFSRRILMELSLCDADHQDLVKRGFTDEQIFRFCARSVEQWQKLSFELPSGFPGIGYSANSLATSAPGYLCPVLSIDRDLIGFQLRTREAENKYRWISSKHGSSQTDCGEQPLAHYWPHESDPKYVAIVEGTGPKPFLCTERTGALTIGAAGGLWASSPIQLVNTIEHMQREYPDLPWVLVPDAGAILNKDIYREIKKLSEFLKSHKVSLSVLWWGQEGKSVGDVDEIDAGILAEAETISIADWLDMAPEEVKNPKQGLKIATGMISASDLRAVAERLLLLDGVEYESQLLVESRTLGVRPDTLEKLVDALRSEQTDEDRDMSRDEIARLISLGKKELRIEDHVHEYLVTPINAIASRMGREPRLFVHCALPVIASLVDARSNIIVNASAKFIQPFIVHCALLAETGSKKSPLTSVLVGPIKKKQRDADKQHKAEMEAFKKAMRAQKSKKKGEPEEEIEEPAPAKEFIVDNFTVEALMEIFGNQPNRPVLAYKDELPSLIGGMNSYKSGGDDNEVLLSAWNGQGVKKNRVGGNRISTDTSHASILGGIQPDKLTKLLISHGGGTDEQGFFARILMMGMRSTPHVLPDDEAEISISPLLEALYDKVSKLEPIQYTFTPQAYEIYRKYYDQIEVRLHDELNPGVKASIAKMEGYAARLAGVFHILWEVVSGEYQEAADGTVLIDSQIPPERVASAIQWCEFCLAEMKMVMADALAASGDTDSMKFKILEFLEKHEVASAGQIRSSVWTLRKIPLSYVQKMLKEMVKLQIIKEIPSGRSSKFAIQSYGKN